MIILMPDETFGKNVHDPRRRKRISLARFAALTAIPYLTLYCIENGTLRDIHHDHVCAICKTLRTTQEKLMGKL